MKKIVRLTEADLTMIVKRVIQEENKVLVKQKYSIKTNLFENSEKLSKTELFNILNSKVNIGEKTKRKVRNIINDNFGKISNKKLLKLLIPMLLTISACQSSGNSEEECNNQQPIELDQNILTQDEIDRQRDSLINATLSDIKGKLRDSIDIIKLQTTKPNSVGGVDCKIVWKNKFKKPIKYLDFYVSALNQVGDEVYSDISRFNGPEKLSLTGPIKPNEVHGNGGIYENVWYNSDIKSCVLRKIKIEFMDGTKTEIDM
jgi:hypothetical protein